MGNTVPPDAGGGGGAPTDAEYTVSSANSSLTNERILVNGTNTTVDTSTPGQIKINANSGAEIGANSDITSMDGLTGNLQAPTGILDSNGNEVLQFGSVSSAVNQIKITNATNRPIIEAVGNSSSIGMIFRTKSQESFIFKDTLGNTVFQITPSSPLETSPSTSYLLIKSGASSINTPPENILIEAHNVLGIETNAATNIILSPVSSGQVQVGFGAHAIAFGGQGTRQIPTSGTLTGEYWHYGSWTTTGAITCNQARLHFRGGAVNINHAITIGTDISGGRAAAALTNAPGGAGGGFGPGFGYGVANFGGSGGGFGGVGGNGGSGTTNQVAIGGCSYPISASLSGSSGSGGSGVTSGVSGNGGAGGGSLYIEATGSITVNANITGTGGNGGNGSSGGTGGGGGSGAGIFISSLDIVTINASKTINASGGTGGNGNGAGGGGGGGGGGIVFIRGAAVINNGTITVAGGSAGTGGAQAPTAGATGVSDIASTVWSVRSAP